MTLRFAPEDTLITPTTNILPSAWINEIIGMTLTTSDIDKEISKKPALADPDITALNINVDGTDLSLCVEADGRYITMQQVFVELSLFLLSPQEHTGGRRPLEFVGHIIKKITANTKGWTLYLDHY